jgi:hypothetical protein
MPFENYPSPLTLMVMTKKLQAIAWVVVVFCSALSAQPPSTNLLQVNTSMYYFKGLPIKFKPFNYFPFNLAYSKFMKDKPYFIGANFYHYRFSDHSHPELMERGDVEAKFFIVVGVFAGYRIFITPKRTFLAKVGLSYRMGYEDQFYSIIYKPNYSEVFATRYKYRNPGFEVSAEQQFKLGERWSLSVGGGYQYFLSRTTTNHHLWVNGGVGYSF